MNEEVDISKFNGGKSRIREVPENLKAENITETAVELSWSEPMGVKKDVILSYQVSVRKAGGSFFRRNPEELLVTKGNETKLTMKYLETGETYEFRVRCKFRDGWGCWGEKTTVRMAPFSWNDCPGNVNKDNRYAVDKKNPRIATKTGDCGNCSITGNTPLPLNKVTSWSVKVLKSRRNDGEGIFIGVAPSDINQNEYENYDKCGWYLSCWFSKLWSGPPHNYNSKEYGPRKGDGEYVHTGDSVGVVMDTTKGELSFELNGVNLGVAFEGIPLDKPLVPCVILWYKGDSVELYI